MPTVVCQHCGKVFSIALSRIQMGKGKYCSRECMDAARHPERETKFCEWCHKPMFETHARQRYCSRSCAGYAQAAEARNHEIVIKKCQHCGKPFPRTSAKTRFCSQECAKEFERQKRLGRGYALFEDPWASGAVPPDCYGRDLYRMPDMVLGF